jgi:glutamate/tyrosine decarboxylase-like PLP-dependent enzyme
MPDVLTALSQAVWNWQSGARARRVTPRLSRHEILRRLAAYDFAQARPLAEVAADALDLLENGSLHATHPRYFGLFNPSVRPAGVAGEALAALYNQQLGAFWHAPAASEIERLTLAWLARRIGPGFCAGACFTTGGSEANLTGVLFALARAFPGFAERGLLDTPARPVFYASDQAHDSFVKIARITGLGASALRRVRSDARLRFDVGELRHSIARDRAAGCAPFLVVATAGTTASGAIDPIGELAEVCAAERLFLHVDAAWGGLALLSDELRRHLSGLERADSVTWDAHKTLPVPMGAGMFFSRAGGVAEAVFGVETAYVPDAEPGTCDAYQRTVQWSRRFVGLKVFLTLAELGATGVAALVDHQTSLAALLRERLRSAGWRIVNETPLPIVCFARDGVSSDRIAAIARGVAAEGGAWISDVRIHGERYLRACITNHESEHEDVCALLAALARALERAA